ncbi:MAG TPA: F0F1 ATP synthase subunit delta [Candidatus Limnocylindrales bacterium]|jgi:F-type H+-transporting ATPase subunit delta
MVRSASSARRYADAAFEVALRDGTVEAWRRELASAAATLSEPRLARALANPAVPLELRAELAGDAVGRSDGGGLIDDIGQLLDRVGRSLKRDALPLTSRLDLAVAAIGPQVSRPVLNLIVLLLRRGRIELLPRVAQEFARLDDLDKHVIHAAATSAAPMGPDEVRALTARLEQLSGGRVELTTDVDPGILGGVMVRLGDRLIDGSVRGRLERLRTKLASGAL